MRATVGDEEESERQYQGDTAACVFLLEPITCELQRTNHDAVRRG